MAAVLERAGGIRPLELEVELETAAERRGEARRRHQRRGALEQGDRRRVGRQVELRTVVGDDARPAGRRGGRRRQGGLSSFVSRDCSPRPRATHSGRRAAAADAMHSRARARRGTAEGAPLTLARYVLTLAVGVLPRLVDEESFLEAAGRSRARSLGSRPISRNHQVGNPPRGACRLFRQGASTGQGVRSWIGPETWSGVSKVPAICHATKSISTIIAGGSADSDRHGPLVTLAPHDAARLRRPAPPPVAR
jgi:hypothetical protein